MRDKCRLVFYLTTGLYLEPLIHPKPGAVTIIYSHPDKGVRDFLLHASIAQSALLASCMSAEENPLLAGLRAYRSELAKRGFSKNIALGSFLLLLPLASALPLVDDFSLSGELFSEASRVIARHDCADVAREYYLILEMLKPSHLGTYMGPIPGVGSGGYPRSLREILAVARWDLVHRELLEGYRVTSRAARRLAERGLDEDAVLDSLLDLLSDEGDTLIAAKFGWTAFRIALEEAKVARELSQRLGARRALEWLDSLWRPRGWNPGAVLDVLAAAIGVSWLALATASLTHRDVL